MPCSFVFTRECIKYNQVHSSLHLGTLDVEMYAFVGSLSVYLPGRIVRLTRWWRWVTRAVGRMTCVQYSLRPGMKNAHNGIFLRSGSNIFISLNIFCILSATPYSIVIPDSSHESCWPHTGISVASALGVVDNFSRGDVWKHFCENHHKIGIQGASPIDSSKTQRDKLPILCDDPEITCIKDTQFCRSTSTCEQTSRAMRWNFCACRRRKCVDWKWRMASIPTWSRTRSKPLHLDPLLSPPP